MFLMKKISFRNVLESTSISLKHLDGTTNLFTADRIKKQIIVFSLGSLLFFGATTGTKSFANSEPILASVEWVIAKINPLDQKVTDLEAKVQQLEEQVEQLKIELNNANK